MSREYLLLTVSIIIGFALVKIETSDDLELQSMWNVTEPTFDPEGKEVLKRQDQVSFNYTIEDRIVGGEETTIEKYPFYAMVLSEKKRMCGGTLIGKREVLTAAHCITYKSTEKKVDPAMIIVKLGSTKMYLSRGKLYKVIDSFIHPKFKRGKGMVHYDVGVLKLEEEVTLSNKVQIAKVAFHKTEELKRMMDEGHECTAVGWGRTTPEGELAILLRHVKVPLITWEKCQSLQEGISPDEHLCTLIEDKDHCKGDSGGGIYCTENTVWGIISYGIDCADPKHPGIAARIDNHGFVVQHFFRSNGIRISVTDHVVLLVYFSLITIFF